MSFCQRLVDEAVDIRNIPNDNIEAEKKGRQVAVKLIEDNLINRIKVLSGQLEPATEDTYE